MTAVPFEYVLWDAAECSEHFGQSKEYFLRHTRHLSGFPSPVPLSKEGHPRWRALAVAQWGVKPC